MHGVIIFDTQLHSVHWNGFVSSHNYWERINIYTFTNHKFNKLLTNFTNQCLYGSNKNIFYYQMIELESLCRRFSICWAALWYFTSSCNVASTLVPMALYWGSERIAFLPLSWLILTKNKKKSTWLPAVIGEVLFVLELNND